MPLSYVVQSQAAPERTTDLQGEFIADTIACAQLSGDHFQADTSEVHQLHKNYPADETAEQWIISIEKRTNGQDEFDALCRHYSGGGNISRRIAAADRLREKLYYNS